MKNTIRQARLHLRVGIHKGLVAGAKLCGNAILQRMFLESSHCRSWSNWSGTTKIQNNVCWVFWQIQRNCRHTCSMSCAIPYRSSSCSWTWIVINKIRMPIVRLPRMTISFFTWRFWRRKPWVRIWSTLIFFDWNSVRESKSGNLLFPFERHSLPFFPFDHQTLSSSVHQSLSCVCFSPRYALPILLSLPLPFPFPLPFLLFTLQLLNGLDYQVFSRCRPISWNTIFHHQCNLVVQLHRLLPIVQIRVQHNFLRWRFCLCCCRVRSRGEKDSPLNFSAYRTIPQTLSLLLHNV